MDMTPVSLATGLPMLTRMLAKLWRCLGQCGQDLISKIIASWQYP